MHCGIIAFLGEFGSFDLTLGERVFYEHLRASMCVMPMLQLREHSFILFLRRFMTISPFFIGMPELGRCLSCNRGYSVSQNYLYFLLEYRDSVDSKLADWLIMGTVYSFSFFSVCCASGVKG